jgi:hypothetical protein
VNADGWGPKVLLSAGVVGAAGAAGGVTPRAVKAERTLRTCMSNSRMKVTGNAIGSDYDGSVSQRGGSSVQDLSHTCSGASPRCSAMSVSLSIARSAPATALRSNASATSAGKCSVPVSQVATCTARRQRGRRRMGGHHMAALASSGRTNALLQYHTCIGDQQPTAWFSATSAIEFEIMANSNLPRPCSVLRARVRKLGKRRLRDVRASVWQGLSSGPLPPWQQHRSE